MELHVSVVWDEMVRMIAYETCLVATVEAVGYVEHRDGDEDNGDSHGDYEEVREQEDTGEDIGGRPGNDCPVLVLPTFRQAFGWSIPEGWYFMLWNLELSGLNLTSESGGARDCCVNVSAYFLGTV